MQIEAIYDRGRLEFVTPLTLKTKRVRVLVTVPEEEIDYQSEPYNLTAEVIERAKVMREKLNKIRNTPPPLDDELPELTPKLQERLTAFALRERR